MKFECPICGATLEHMRESDGIIRNEIMKDGSYEEVYNDSNGSDTVYCSEDMEHEIPPELVEAVLDIIV